MHHSITTIVLNITVGLIFYLPSGLYTGLLTQRLSYKNYLNAIIKNEAWNSAIKVIIAALIVYASYKPPFLVRSDTNHPLSRLVSFAIRIIAATIGALVGSALQPVAITGGIACGKSTVSKILWEKKFIIIDLDEIAHDVLDPRKMGHDSAYFAILKEFGTSILVDDEKCLPPPIDRTKLGNVIFQDKSKKQKLNNITHPLIFKIMIMRILRYNIWSPPDVVVAVDIPLFFETGVFMKILFGLVVVVACSPSIQEERLRKRNPEFTVEHCRERIDSQIPILDKVKMADVVIWNNGSIEELGKNVEKAQEEVKKRVIGWRIRFPLLLPILGFIFAFIDLYWN